MTDNTVEITQGWADRKKAVEDVAKAKILEGADLGEFEPVRPIINAMVLWHAEAAQGKSDGNVPEFHLYREAQKITPGMLPQERLLTVNGFMKGAEAKGKKLAEEGQEAIERFIQTETERDTPPEPFSSSRARAETFRRSSGGKGPSR